MTRLARSSIDPSLPASIRWAQALILAVLAGGCAGRPDPAPGMSVDSPQPGSAVAPETILPDASRAQDLYENARAWIRTGAFSEGFDLLEQASRLDPASGNIRDLRNEVSRILNRRHGEWHTGIGWELSTQSLSLLDLREALSRSMARFEAQVLRHNWSGAEAESSLAAETAREIVKTIAILTGGRFGERWSEQARKAVQRGDFAGAGLCLELALQLSRASGPAEARSFTEALARRLDEVRAFENPQICVTRNGVLRFRRGMPPGDLHRPMTKALLVIIRCRFLLGEVAIATRHLDTLLALSPASAEAQRLSYALRALPAWDPWDGENTIAGRTQQAYTRAASLAQIASDLELQGRFGEAAENFDLASSDLRWLPHSLLLEEREAEVKSASSRCRRLAEDASR